MVAPTTLFHLKLDTSFIAADARTTRMRSTKPPSPRGDGPQPRVLSDEVERGGERRGELGVRLGIDLICSNYLLAS